MKVKELIKRLLCCDPDAEVIGYDYLQEQDFIINEVEDLVIYNTDDDSLRYCGGYSIVEEQFIGMPIVYLSE